MQRSQCLIAKVRCVSVKCLQNALSQVSRSAAEVIIIIRYEGTHTEKRGDTQRGDRHRFQVSKEFSFYQKLRKTNCKMHTGQEGHAERLLARAKKQRQEDYFISQISNKCNISAPTLICIYRDIQKVTGCTMFRTKASFPYKLTLSGKCHIYQINSILLKLIRSCMNPITFNVSSC